MPQLVILANGQCTLLRWWFWTFYAYAPVKIEYAINRFAMETKRLLDVLDQHLAKTNIWLVLNIALLILQRSLGMAVLLKLRITARSF